MWSRFHAPDPQVVGTTVQNVAIVTWCTRLCAPDYRHCSQTHTKFGCVCCHQFVLYSCPCQCCSVQTGNGSVMHLKVQELCQFCSSSDKPCQKYTAELWKPSFAALNMMIVSSVASLAIIRLSIQLAQCIASTAFDFMVPFVKVYVQNV